MERNKIISKTAYLIYKQCHKYLWYFINDRQSIPELDARARFNFKAGNFTGSLAKKCFPEGIEIGREKDLRASYLNTLEMMALRKPLFDAGILLKDACSYNNKSYDVYSRADMLLPAGTSLSCFNEALDDPEFSTINVFPEDKACWPGVSADSTAAGEPEEIEEAEEIKGKNEKRETEEAEMQTKPDAECWDIVEVKISTGVKKINLYDLAFQKYCFQASGINIRNCYVMHINSEYMRNGKIDPFKIFKISEVSARMEKLNLQIKNDLQKMAEVISKECPPHINPGKFCVKPFNCPMKKQCWKSINSENILYLYSINHKMINRLNDSGIKDINDIPLDFFGINEKQKLQIKHTKNAAAYINKTAIENFLKQVSYPVFFLDFETFSSPIPLLENTRPYQNIPFQFSLHVLRKPGGAPEHYHFLSDGESDPRPELLNNLRNWFGFTKSRESFDGTVIVYDESFERSILRDLVAYNTEHVGWIFKVADRIVDLCYPFRNFYYYSPVQRGSASVKRVLPALTKKSYDEMAISNGDIAAVSFLERSGLWEETTSGIRQPEKSIINIASRDFSRGGAQDSVKPDVDNNILDKETETIRNNLIEYCKLDTEGLYHIIQELEKLVK